ncbi:MAG TPA: dienelactone hydrolase family protein [Acidimicrobiales bacterium]|nr:dienelactone hydrolase family protein [Acidimicrobiales bacterium]
MSRYETVQAGDGGTFEAYCALPAGGSGPGILLFQEIFGINDNMRTLAERLAGEGYVVLVPDMFWRIEPRFERKDESGIGDAFAIAQKFDFPTGVADIRATHAHLLAMSECTGKVGAMGFCLGGGLAFAAATMSRVDGRGPDAAVPYYGSPVNNLLDQAPNLECPTMFHYGNNDAFIPEEKIAEVEQAFASHPNVVFHRYEAGHAFSNWDAPSMYDKDAADLAWSRTLEFLGAHLTG